MHGVSAMQCHRSGKTAGYDDGQRLADLEKEAIYHAVDRRSGTENGTGGMITKLHAGAIAEKAGFDMAIVNGEKAELLYPLCEGKPEGTFFRFRKPC